MAAKRYTVDVNGTKETIQTYTVLGGGGAKGEGLRFRLTKGAKVELTDDAARNGPQGIKVRRIGDDLHIALPGSDVAKPDVVIQDFYKNNEGNQLIGRGADGQYHSYTVDKITTNLPASPEMSTAVISPWGKVTEAVAPVIATETVPTAAPSTAPVAAEGAKMGTLGWVLGGVGVLGIAAAAGGGGGGSSSNPDAPIKSVEATGTANEGSAATFTVTLRNPGNTATTWRITLGGDSASAGDLDAANLSFSSGVTYNSVAGTITVPANITSFTVTVPTVQDTAIEANELIKLDVEGTSGVATLVDNDVQRIATVVATNGVAVVESQTLSYTVTLNAPSARTETYALSLTGGAAPAATPGTDTGAITATNGVTYDAATGRLTVPPNVESFQVSILAVSDAQREGAENLRLTIGDLPSVAGTITDNDAGAVNLTSAATMTEGGSAVYQVALLASSTVAETYAFTVGGTAEHGTPAFTAGVTYNATAGTISVPAGVTTFQVTVPTAQDTLYENAETLNVTVGSKTGGNVTVNSDDVAPTLTLSLNGGSPVAEGNATLTYTVTLSAPSGLATSVNYATTAGTATAGQDFTASSGTVNIAAGATTGTFTVPIGEDLLVEGNEAFSVALSAPVNATLGATSSLTTTIADDDVQSVSGVSNATSVVEGSAVALVYAVTLSNPSAVATTLTMTLGGTAVAADLGAFTYSNGVTASGNTLTIPANTDNFTISVLSAADGDIEGPETLTLTLGGKTGTGSITDDDFQTVGTVTPPAAAVDEGGSLVYTVNLSPSSPTPTTHAISYGGTADAADHTAATTYSGGVTESAGVLTIPGGLSSFTVSVPISVDTTAEAGEALTVTVGGVSAIGNINASDAPVAATVQSVAAAAATVDEGQSLSYTIALSGAALGTESYTVSAGAGAAGVAGNADLGLSTISVTGGTLLPDGNIRPNAGETSIQISVPVGADATAEGDESLLLVVGGISAAAVTVADTSTAASPEARIASLLDTTDGSALVLVADVGSGASIVYTPSASTESTASAGDSTAAALAFSASTSVEDLLAQQLTAVSPTP